jgi:hypothetical protein
MIALDAWSIFIPALAALRPLNSQAKLFQSWRKIRFNRRNQHTRHANFQSRNGLVKCSRTSTAVQHMTKKQL